MCDTSPTLFNMFLNDLPDRMKSDESCPAILNGKAINCLMYADDNYSPNLSNKTRSAA